MEPTTTPYSLADHLSDAERDTLLADLDRDGYVVLPRLLPQTLLTDCLRAIDLITDEKRGDNTRQSVKVMNCVDDDPAFRHLMLYGPALQMAHDVFGPMFHLCQSNFVSRPNDGKTQADFVSSSPWHADGPRPNLFPKVDGAMGLHYLKFGYFLTDLTHGNGGPLQVVRGSHKKPELDNKKHSGFLVSDYEEDIVTFNCPAGTVVAFHQAQWHAAPPNESNIERKNVYISYCPTWMRPLDREPLTEADDLSQLTPEEKWLLGEPRPALRWWLPSKEDAARMARYGRDATRNAAPGEMVRYD